jgi:predicted Zn-dependent protease
MSRTPSLRCAALLFAVALPLLLAGGCAKDQTVIQQAQQVHAGLKPAVMEDPELNGYLQAVGRRVIVQAQALDQQKFGPDSHRSEDSSWMYSSNMQFHLVNSKTLNAFTTGGEHMYIYNELFQQCRTEDELSAVMAHEYSHVYCRHVAKGMDRQKILAGTAVAAQGAGYAYGGSEKGAQYAKTFSSAAAAAGQFLGLTFTRQDEAEADKLGFAFYSHAGWAPDHFGDFFQQLIDKGLDTTPALQSDHPTCKSRVEVAKQEAAALPPEAARWKQPPIANAQQFAALKARAAQLAKTMPNDEQLQKAQTLLSAFPSCVTAVDQPDQKAARQRLQALLAPKPQPAAK